MKLSLLVLFVLFCACQTARRPQTIRDPEAAKRRWESSVRARAYEMTYRIECVCDAMPVVTVNVDKNGHVISIHAEPSDQTPEVRDVVTMEKLFKMIENNRRGRLPASSLEA